MTSLGVVKSCPLPYVTDFHSEDEKAFICIGSSVYCSFSRNRKEFYFYYWQSSSSIVFHSEVAVISLYIDKSDGASRVIGLSSTGEIYAWLCSEKNSDGDEQFNDDSSLSISEKLIYTFSREDWSTKSLSITPYMTVDDTSGILVIVLPSVFIKMVFLKDCKNEIEIDPVTAELESHAVDKGVAMQKSVVLPLPIDCGTDVNSGILGHDASENIPESPQENVPQLTSIIEAVDVTSTAISMHIEFDHSKIVGRATDPVCVTCTFLSEDLEFEESRVCICIETWIDIWRFNVQCDDRTHQPVPLSDEGRDGQMNEINLNYVSKYGECSSVRVQTDHSGWISAVSNIFVYHSEVSNDEVCTYVVTAAFTPYLTV